MTSRPDRRDEYERIHANPRFSQLVHSRRKITLYLFILSMAIFFAMPVAMNYYPDILNIRVMGPVNIGLAYLVGQYFVGAAIAWFYVSRLRNVDTLAKELVSECGEKPSSAESYIRPQGLST